MTESEFNTFMDYLAPRFPSVIAWIRGRDALAIQRVWCDVLASVDLGDAQAVVAAMHAGELERPMPDDLPGVIRREAKRRRNTRSHEIDARQFQVEHDRRAMARLSDDPLDMRGLLLKAFQAKRDGKPIASVFPPVDETKSRRYRCATCWDEGVVRVWHPRTVAMVRKLIDDGKEWTGHAGVYDAVAACSCSLGDSWCNRTAKGNESRTFLPRYSPQNFCRLLTSTANEADRDRLWDWVQLWKPANFTPAFSEWNSQGELV